MEMITFENAKSYLIIVKLLTCIDDTVLLKNNIINVNFINFAKKIKFKGNEIEFRLVNNQ